MALFKIFNNIDSSNGLPNTYTKGYCYFDATSNKFYIDTAGDGTTNGTRVPLNALRADISKIGQRIPFVTCTTAAGTATKTCTIESASELSGLTSGTMLAIYFENGNTAADPKISLSAVPVANAPLYCTYGQACTGSAPYTWSAGQVILFIYMAAVGSAEARWVMAQFQDGTKVYQTSSTANEDYRLLLSSTADDTTRLASTRKATNLRYNPSQNKLSTGSLALTGTLDVTGNTNLHSTTTIDSLTAGSLIVNGNSSFINDVAFTKSPTAPTPADGDSSTKVATTAFIKWGNIAGKPSSFTPASHSHGNITNAGELGTASRAVITDGNKKITVSSVTSTELGYLSGVTSAIQTQLNAKAPLASPALTGTPTAPTAAAGTNTTQIATTAFVTTAVRGLSGPMHFKGTLGTGGTITSLPAAAAANEGYTYKVITTGTYTVGSNNFYGEVGDLFVSNGSTWINIPSGDEQLTMTVSNETLSFTYG